MESDAIQTRRKVLSKLALSKLVPTALVPSKLARNKRVLLVPPAQAPNRLARSKQVPSKQVPSKLAVIPEWSAQTGNKSTAVLRRLYHNFLHSCDSTCNRLTMRL